jgi:hypothetical protein
MRSRSLFTGILLGIGSGFGAVLFRRRAARRRERVDLYFADGTIVSVTEGSHEADRLLQHARDALGAAGS